MKYHAVLIYSLVEALQDIFEHGFYADKVIERQFKKNKKWGKRDRQFMAETIYDMTRYWRRLGAYDGQEWIPKNYFLRWAVYEYWKNKNDVTGFLKEKIKEAQFEDIDLHQCINQRLLPQEEVSVSDWLYETMTENYKNEAHSVLNALNNQAAVYLRTNFLKTDRDTLILKLKSEDFDVEVAKQTDEGIKLVNRKNVFITEAFKRGDFEVQDIASQKVAHLLAPKPGERVADMCAGAGGKTLHLAALMQNKGTLLASDVHSKKLEQLKLRARRAGVSNLRIQLVENSKDVKKHQQMFDAVLIDAPCSGSGVIRRNPDTKWKFGAEDLESLLKTQSEILDNYSKLVKSGGRLVYATCSLLTQENEVQVENFLKAHPQFKLKQELHCRPDLADEDGFFAALMVKTP